MGGAIFFGHTMINYRFTYTSEQRAYIDVDADTLEEAEAHAMKYIETLELSAPDDESDDGGELWLDETVPVLD